MIQWERLMQTWWTCYWRCRIRRGQRTKLWLECVMNGGYKTWHRRPSARCEDKWVLVVKYENYYIATDVTAKWKRRAASRSDEMATFRRISFASDIVLYARLINRFYVLTTQLPKRHSLKSVFIDQWCHISRRASAAPVECYLQPISVHQIGR